MKWTNSDIEVLKKLNKSRDDVWKKAFSYYNKAHKSNLRRSCASCYTKVRKWVLDAIDLAKNGTL